MSVEARREHWDPGTGIKDDCKVPRGNVGTETQSSGRTADGLNR